MKRKKEVQRDNWPGHRKEVPSTLHHSYQTGTSPFKRLGSSAGADIDVRDIRMLKQVGPYISNTV